MEIEKTLGNKGFANILRDKGLAPGGVQRNSTKQSTIVKNDGTVIEGVGENAMSPQIQKDIAPHVTFDAGTKSAIIKGSVKGIEKLLREDARLTETQEIVVISPEMTTLSHALTSPGSLKKLDASQTGVKSDDKMLAIFRDMEIEVKVAK